MDVIRLVRAVGGLLSIMTLLGLFVASVIIPEVQVQQSTVAILMSLIAGLLGIDMALTNFEIKHTGQESASDDGSNGGENNES